MSTPGSISTPDAPGEAAPHALSEREQQILRLVVKSFVSTAGPIGSRSLARQHPQVGLSPASIRNTMSDLEEMGYLDQPHTSAGRVPTERGYRAFVNALMERPEVPAAERSLLQAQLARLMGDTEELFRESSRILGRLTSLLGVILSPKLSSGILDRLDVVPLSSSRLMFVLSVRGGLVKTIVLEFDADLKRKDFERVVAILNERLAGLTLDEIRRTYDERVKDIDDDATGIVRLVLDESALLFSEPAEGRVRYGSARDILAQPEFQEPANLRRLIELMEDEDALVRLLETLPEDDAAPRRAPGAASVSIGSEHGAPAKHESRYSIVTSRYRLGDAVGTVGVIGPTRMDYPRVMALVESTAALLSRPPGE